ncbi:HxlR family transcriptional regulator [Actinomadura pelletieri DSM 43383]|uniref:HxlR family transcriptional regulator n=1 Tax=Actinomadura pelletieri DSM 43383 TaxID=1120940 RepID=A0A495QUA9_9ACTN|nr:helix-turn-helix domain-containing protein [Actinomadura pelletieri]RKS77055.1 HxlR family transcriptional regulator [Actinomadura pelletieri DSM 43383]
MPQRNSRVSPEDVHPVACPIREIIDSVAGKWSVQIVLLAVSKGPVRFTEFERAIEGISRRMLTLTLRNLERDGLLIRTVYPTVPPKVEYSATEMACELKGAFEQLAAWALRHQEAIGAAREAYDRARAKPVAVGDGAG